MTHPAAPGSASERSPRPDRPATRTRAARRLLTTGRAVTLGLTLVLLLLATFTIWAAGTISDATALTAQAVRSDDGYEEARYLATLEDSLLRKYRLDPSAAIRAQHQTTADTLSATLQAMRQDGGATDRALVDDLLAAQARYLATTQRLFMAVDAGDRLGAAAIQEQEVRPILNRIERAIGEAADQRGAALQRRLDALHGTERLIVVLTPIVFLVGLGAILLLLLLLQQYQARITAALRREAQHQAAEREALRDSEARYRQMFENHPAIQLLIDPATGDIVDANPAACAFYGYPYATLTATDLAALTATPAGTSGEALASLATDADRALHLRHRLVTGEVREVEARCGPLDIAGRRLLFAIIHDVTERARAEHALRHRALHDTLTELPNRTLFMDRLDHALARAACHPAARFAVLYLDLDRFKQINDSLGHLRGDQLLVAAAQRLRAALPPHCTVARLGGDEFAILVEDIAAVPDAAAVAARVHAALDAPFPLGGQEFFLTTSIGIAMGAAYHEPDDLLRDADTAMYRAKAAGKARHVIFDPAMHEHAVTRLRLENDLRRAIEGEELTVHYQPVIALDSGALAGFEALVRWEHPTRGSISAGEFIPLAEETGLIAPLDRWVLAAACRQVRRWQERFPAHANLMVSVNVSGGEMAAPGFVDQITRVLHATGLAPRHLKLEITERVLVEHIQEATYVLEQLRTLGVRISLDDFGVGYSSLRYLQRFPIDMMKIDRAFIHGRGAALENPAIVRAIVTLAHTLGMQVTGEGVETAAQHDALRALACDYGQGYHFSPPVSGERAAALLVTIKSAQDPIKH